MEVVDLVNYTVDKMSDRETRKEQCMTGWEVLVISIVEGSTGCLLELETVQCVHPDRCLAMARFSNWQEGSR